MKTAGLKTTAAPRAARSVKSACPAEACLREWATEQKRWRKFVSAGHKPWGIDEATGHSVDSPEFAAHCERVHEIEERATWALATSQIGAAYQALLSYACVPDLTEIKPPAVLTNEHHSAIDKHDLRACRLALSIYLRLRVRDEDLLLRESYVTGADSLQQVITEAGFNLLPEAA